MIYYPKYVNKNVKNNPCKQVGACVDQLPLSWPLVGHAAYIDMIVVVRYINSVTEDREMPW